MDEAPTSRPPSCRLLLLLNILTLQLLLMAGGVEACRVTECSNQYGDDKNLQDFQATVWSCQLAKDYLRCLRGTARACRGDINFHFVVSWLEKKISQNDCEELLRAAAATGAAVTPPPKISTAPPTTTPSPPPPLPPHCVWRGHRRFRHCGLFGDPHIKTFENEYQTCRMRGAWPLVDNPFLAVQVTNEPVMEGSLATATSKVTVIVRDKNTTCTPEKTYEAHGKLQLPSVFIDGTRQSGPDQAVLLTSYEDGARVEIVAQHIASRVIVRRTGSSLAISIQMPEKVALYAGDDTGMQVCRYGCPKSERMDTSAASLAEAAAALPWEEAVARCRRSSPPGPNLTHPYLDWCAFDVMTTASEEFVEAARSAQEDVARLDPGSLNGTAPGFEPEAALVSGATAPPPPARLWALAAVALLVAAVAGS